MMKRTISIILSALMLCAVWVAPTSAAEKRNVAYGKEVTSNAPGGFYEAEPGAGGYEDYRVVDGDTRTMTFLQVKTFDPEEEAWLKVDLGNYYTISEIQIAARTDTEGYPPGENGSVQIRASVDDKVPSEMSLLGTVPEEGIKCGDSYTEQINDSTKYRYVALYRKGGSHMSLSELYVYTEDEEPTPLDELVNVARGKSYTYSGECLPGLGPQCIIDGDAETAMYMKTYGWVMVDLGDWYTIERIEFVTGPWEEGTKQRANASIVAGVTNDINKTTLIAETPEEPSLSTSYMFELSDEKKATKYRYVAIGANNPTPDRLFCSELRVFVKGLTAPRSENVALGKKISYSGTFLADGYGPESLVDGTTDYATYMCNSPYCWIKVDLGNWYTIDTIECVTGPWGDGGAEARHIQIRASAEDFEDIAMMDKIGTTPADSALSTTYIIEPADKTKKYRYVAIHAVNGAQPYLLCSELRVRATVSEDIGPWSITKDGAEVSTASVGDTLSFSTSIRNFDYVGGKKPYLMYVAAYDKNHRLVGAISGNRFYELAGTSNLTVDLEVPEGAVECRSYLIRSLADASMLVDYGSVTIQ